MRTELRGWRVGGGCGVRWWRMVRLFRMIFGPAERLDTREIERMGLLAVKIAQMYAIRADLLGPEKTALLGRLYEQATPMAGGEFLAAVRREAPAGLLEALEWVDEEPLAVASLGQVHRGRLKDGTEVVLKVLRADHAAAFSDDVAALRMLAGIACFFYPPLTRLADPLGTLETIRRTTEREMDLTAEARGTTELARLRDEGLARLPHLGKLRFPKVHEEFTTPRILVSGYVAAPTVKRLLSDGRLGYEALLMLFRIHGYFMFLRGAFHGDFHPGNLCYQDGEIWFLDNANVERVPVAFSRGLLAFMVCLGRRDHAGAARAIEALGLEPLPDPEPFRRAFATLYDGFGGKPVGEQSLTSQMMRTVRMAVERGLEFPEGAFPVIKSLMYLDGMALAAAPDRVLLEDVASFAGDFGEIAPES